MKISIRKSAIRDFKKIGKHDKEGIYAKILALKYFPKVQNVKKLTNFEPAYRLRVGSYRVLFDITEDSIEIGRVLHRKESYK
ncbi:MAG: type II toxin-antitoxin system RelE family toxin [Desulfococcaceae bacterium]